MSEARFSCSRRDFIRGVGIFTGASAAGALLAACAGEKVVAQAAVADIPVGGAQIIGGWVVAQPQRDTFTAFSTTCPHAGGKINSFEKMGDVTVAVCPKHASKFDVATGEVLEGPSRAGMTPAKNVTVSAHRVEVSN